MKAALIKDNSIANQLNLGFVNHRDRKLKIKLEIDCNPPVGSEFDYTYLDFPVDYEVCHQDISSNFALKIHALLCRVYLKGRDWYDFNWYIAQGITPNLRLLENALYQYGPYQGQNLTANREWLIGSLREKIASIHWQDAAGDVERFLRPVEQKSLSLWSERFYENKLKALESTLGG